MVLQHLDPPEDAREDGVKEAPDKKKDLSIEISTAQKAGKNMVIAKKLKVKRAGRTIFEDLDMEIDSGTSWAFRSNGSGKTTLVKALIGEIPARGAVDSPGGQDRVLRPRDMTISSRI